MAAFIICFVLSGVLLDAHNDIINSYYWEEQIINNMTEDDVKRYIAGKDFVLGYVDFAVEYQLVKFLKKKLSS